MQSTIDKLKQVNENIKMSYADKMLALFNEMEYKCQALIKQLSEVDMKVSDVLHYIEDGNFNACQGYIYCKQIEVLRKERRIIKNELIPLRDFKNKIVPKNIKMVKEVVEIENKRSNIYHPRYLQKEDVLSGKFL